MTVFHIAIVPPKPGNPVLQGLRMSASPGTVGVSKTLTLTGLRSTLAQGTLTPGKSGLTLTGMAIQSAQGILTPMLTFPLTGQRSTLAKGSVSPFHPLTGQKITSRQGTIVSSQAVTRALVGRQSAVVPGVLSCSLNFQITVMPLPDATVGTFYQAQFTVSGGSGNYFWSRISITPGWGNWFDIIDSNLGTGGGTPQMVELETVVIGVHDNVTGIDTTATFSINVTPQ